MIKNRVFRAASAIAGVSLLILGVTAGPAPAAPAHTAATAAPTAPNLHAPKGAPAPVKGKSGKYTVGGGVHTLSGPFYTYAGAVQDGAGSPRAVISAGVAANVMIAKPWKASTDYHTLAELAVENDAVGTARQVVEVGWTVDPVVNSGCTPNPACLQDPFLFTYAWRNGTGLGYNAAGGFVDNGSNPINAGASLASVASAAFPSNVKQMIISYATTTCGSDTTGGWWVGYDSVWLGCYPNSIWTGSGVTGFTGTNRVQLFDEVAAQSTTPCTDAGNGKDGSAGTIPLDATDPTYIGSTTLQSPVGGLATSLTTYATNSSAYSALGFGTGNRTFTVGGKGWNSSGGFPGNLGSC